MIGQADRGERRGPDGPAVTVAGTPRRRRVDRRSVLIGSITVAFLVGFLLLARLAQVHSQTWEWRLTASPAPTKLVFHDRDYRRGEPLTADNLRSYAEHGQAAVGRTAGGGSIYEPTVNITSGLTPTSLIVKVDDRWIGYSLMGGP